MHGIPDVDRFRDDRRVAAVLRSPQLDELGVDWILDDLEVALVRDEALAGGRRHHDLLVARAVVGRDDADSILEADSGELLEETGLVRTDRQRYDEVRLDGLDL